MPSAGDRRAAKASHGGSVERHVVCMMSCTRMVEGDEVRARVVTVVMRARVERKVRIQRLVQRLLGSDINDFGDSGGSLTRPLGST
jgi:hypothetical protein